MTSKLSDLVTMHMNSMKDHQLTVLCDTEKVKVFRCGRTDSNNFMFQVSFTPCGIAIQGDITPERNGTTSCRGYGLQWFCNSSSPDYLSEKFLTKKFDPDRAKRCLEELKKEYPNKALDWIDTDDASLFVEAVRGEGIDNDEFGIYGYLPNEQAVLVAIERKFAELYASSL